MSYEPGVLVRRQQREYPPELRKEIALAALEVGNNREVARLYSERLGYTVNESTVRGIKKRYLEGIQKGKIESPGLSPRSGAGSIQGDKESESEGDDANVQPENVMKLQLEVLEGKMKDSRGTVEVDESNLINNDGMDESDMNGSSTLVISESALSINGDDSRDSCNQLSIDTGGPDIEAEALEALESVKPSIRIAKGLTKDSNENHAPMGILAAQLTSGLKRKQTSSNNGVLNSNSLGNNINGLVLPMVKKQRPNATENDQEILGLEKEIRALQWLARRKEREWDQVISLLKQKEERLMKAQRAKVMIQVEAEHLLTKYKSPATSINLNTSSVSSPAQPTSVMMSTSQLQPVIVPQQQVLILPSPTSMATSTPTSRQIQPKPATAATLAVKPLTSTPTSSVGGTNLRNNKLPSPVQQQKPSNGVSNELQDQKTLSAIRNLQKAASNATVTVTTAVNNPKEESKKNTPNCQGCGKKKSEFVCAGCSNRWYCSRECQVEDWDEHADDCSG